MCNNLACYCRSIMEIQQSNADSSATSIRGLIDIVGTGGGEELIYCLKSLDECMKLHAAYHDHNNLKRETTVVAQIVGWSRNTVYQRLRDWNLNPNDFRDAAIWRDVVSKSTVIQGKMQQLVELLQTTEAERKTTQAE